MPFRLFKRPEYIDPTEAVPLPDADPNDPQWGLGAKVGKHDIRCALEGRPIGRRQRWCIDNASSKVHGALFFELQFVQDRSSYLESAIVRIDLRPPGDDPTQDGPKVLAYAPGSGIRGPPFYERIGRNLMRLPQVNISAPGGGAGFSGVGDSTTSESSVSHSWLLIAGVASSRGGRAGREMEYQWTCGHPKDNDARSRKFKTSLIIQQKFQDPVEKFGFSVQIEAKSANKRQYCMPSPTRSRWISPRHNIEMDEFDQLVNTLERDTVRANQETTPEILLRPQSITDPQVAQDPGAGGSSTSPLSLPIIPPASLPPLQSTSAVSISSAPNVT